MSLPVFQRTADNHPQTPTPTTWPLPIKTDNTANPPTDAQLDTAAGKTPATFGTGNCFIVDDNNANANVYLVFSNGTSWWYVALTKAA